LTTLSCHSADAVKAPPATGAAVAAGALWSLALLPGVLLVIDRAIIPKEERHLAERFAEDNERYRLRVPRWL
jgi:protein-S-isoprenylcysteine O-methyltransferase Ste14